jgi:archaellum component FlaC
VVLLNRAVTPDNYKPHSYNELFSDWDSTEVGNKRNHIKQLIKDTENKIRRARQNVLDVPRQVEETRNLLIKLHTQFPTVRRLLTGSNTGVEGLSEAQSEDIRNALFSLDQQREQLTEFLKVSPRSENSQNAVTCTLRSLDVAERFVRKVEAVGESSQQIPDELQQEIEKLDQTLLEGLRNIRNSFALGKSSSSLDEELNRLQILLGSIQYRVAIVRRYSTLERLEAKVEQISDTVESVTADQRAVLSLVQSTGVSIERWLQRFYFECPIPLFKWLPSGWLLGFVPNRVRDIKRTLRQMSGARDDYSENTATTQGKIIAGLTTSLVAWLSITFSISLGLVLLKVAFQTLTQGRAERIERANIAIADFAEELSSDITNSEVKSGIDNLPASNAAAIENSRQQLSQSISMIETFYESGGVSDLLEDCKNLLNNIGQDNDLTTPIEDCRNAATETFNPGNNPSLQKVSSDWLSLTDLQFFESIQEDRGSSEPEVDVSSEDTNIPDPVTRLSFDEAFPSIFTSLNQQLSDMLISSLDTLEQSRRIDQQLSGINSSSLSNQVNELAAKIKREVLNLQANEEVVYRLKALERGLSEGDANARLERDRNGYWQIVLSTQDNEGSKFIIASENSSVKTDLSALLSTLENSNEDFEAPQEKELSEPLSALEGSDLDDLKILLTTLESTFAETIEIKEADERLERVSSTALRWINNPVYTNSINRILLALLAGALGGIVSILTRIQGIGKDISSPFLYGLLQPTIGAAFSLIVMMILSTNIVDVIKVLPREFYLQDTAEETLYIRDTNGDYVQVEADLIDTTDLLTTEEVFVILVAGFIIGFSERLAKNAFVTVASGPSASN